MRPHGRVEIDQSKPRAKAVCDRCGGLYNHHKLKWATDWRGTKLQNLRFLVCDSCYDQYQQNGQRVIILPPDPVPIMNARPEHYVADSNPLSALGANPTPALWQYGSRIGTMTQAAGVPAAFDGNANKPSWMSAMIITPVSSFGNYVGINWSGYLPTTASSLSSPVLSHTVDSFTITAPNDSVFGSSKYALQGSNDAAIWTTLASSNIAGTVGETISEDNIPGGRYVYHRMAFYQNISLTPIAVAQVSFSVSDGSSI